MLMSVLNLTPDQVNALPVEERNAVQQLVHSFKRELPSVLTRFIYSAASLWESQHSKRELHERTIV